MMNDLIQCDPNIMMGKPTIKGTRITVELILERLAAGEQPQDLLIAYPQLTADAISAALSFAAHTLSSDETYFPSQASS